MKDQGGRRRDGLRWAGVRARIRLSRGQDRERGTLGRGLGGVVRTLRFAYDSAGPAAGRRWRGNRVLYRRHSIDGPTCIHSHDAHTTRRARKVSTDWIEIECVFLADSYRLAGTRRPALLCFALLCLHCLLALLLWVGTFGACLSYVVVGGG